MLELPRLYPILDRSVLPVEIARLWLQSGVRLVQYRNKNGTPRQCLSEARELVRLAHQSGRRERVILVMNDRADLGVAADFDGVHIGEEDMSVAAARKVVGKKLLGVSCHNELQVELANETDADYVAIGPLFATASKADPDPVVGIDRLRHIRKLTTKPLVAIGGITRENAQAVWDAGADSVAVIGDLARDPERDLAAWLALLV